MTGITANAADGRQVRAAKRIEKTRRDREIEDVLWLLEQQPFRRFAWRLMGLCGYMENPTHARGDMTHQNIGKGDIARWLISEIGEAGGIDKWLLMQKEAWEARNKEQQSADAFRTAAAAESKKDNDE